MCRHWTKGITPFDLAYAWADVCTHTPQRPPPSRLFKYPHPLPTIVKNFTLTNLVIVCKPSDRLARLTKNCAFLNAHLSMYLFSVLSVKQCLLTEHPLPLMLTDLSSYFCALTSGKCFTFMRTARRKRVFREDDRISRARFADGFL